MTVRTYKYRQYDGQEISKKRAKDDSNKSNSNDGGASNTLSFYKKGTRMTGTTNNQPPAMQAV